MQRAAILSLLLAIVLGLGAFWALRRGPGPAPAPAKAWLRLIDPAKVEAVTVTISPQERVTIARVAGTDVWVLRHARDRMVLAEGPVKSEHVRGVVRLMHDLDTLPAQADAGAWSGGTGVSLYTETDQVGEIEVGQAALGGRVPVRLAAPDGARVVLTDARFAGVFVASSLDAWIDGALVSRLPGEPSSVTVDAQGRVAEVVRAGAGWNVARPIVAPGDAAACGAWVESVLTLTGRASTASEADVAALPLRLVATATTPVRRLANGEVETAVLRQTARVHEDSGGRRLAIVEATWTERGVTKPAWSTRVVDVTSDGTSLPHAEAGPLLSRLATRLASADVAGLRVAEADAAEGKHRAEFSRTVRGWRRVEVTTEHDVNSADAAAIAGLITLACETPASAATLDAPPDTKALARVDLLSGGLVAEALNLGLGTVPLPSGTAEVLVIRSGKVARVYPALAHRTLIDWLRAHTVPEG